jgi:DoxX-like protein
VLRREGAPARVGDQLMRTSLRVFIAFVWIANGLGAKIIGLVPRHEQIVARILGEGRAEILTPAIGGGELLLCAWFLSGKWHRANVLLQMGLVATMNAIEFAIASDLLLWGPWNAAFAAGFIAILYTYEFGFARADSDS